LAKTGKRMYCPECKKNRTWMSAYKKQQMEPGEKPYDFRFFVCQTCEYGYDPKTGLEIPEWRERYYSAEKFEAQEYGENCDDCGGFLSDCIGYVDGESCNQAGVETRLCSKCGDGPRCDSCRKIYDVYGGEDPICKVCSQMVPYNPVSNTGESHKWWCKWDASGGQTAGTCETCWSEPWMWSNDLGYIFFPEDSPYNNSDYERMCLHCMEEDFPEIYGHLVNQPVDVEPISKKWWQFWKSENFEAVVVEKRKPKGTIDKVLMQQDMMMRAQLQELTLKLDTDVRLGIISEDQADDIMIDALMKLGLMPTDFDAEDWRDVAEWSDPPSEVSRGVVDLGKYANWETQVEMNQAEKALDYFMDLAEGSATTELESRFILSPRHFDQYMSRFAPGQYEYVETMEGFGEGPYPVALDILTPAEIIAQTELQLHTIFEAFETVLEGAPDEHDHDDDHDDHDHDEFETILELYSPYQPELYRVHVRTAEGVKMMGEYTNLVAAQELADDWNAPGYGKPVARIERVRARNGAFRGLSRVVFDDGSYLTFALMGDLTHRDSEFVNMTSFFIHPETFEADNKWWESKRNN